MSAIVVALLLATTPPPGLRLPDGAHPVRYAATLSVDPRRDRFDGSVDITVAFDRTSSSLWLDAENLEISRATIAAGGTVRPVTAKTTSAGVASFSFESPVTGEATLHVEYAGRIDPDESTGLFHRDERGHDYAFTQFEELGARRVFPCFDEPAFKTPWSLVLRVPKGAVAVSNTPVVDERIDGDTKTVAFAQTRPLPSYLVAFAVGPFEIVDAGTAGRAKTPLRVIAPAGHPGESKPVAAVIAATLPALESWFDLAYPYDKLDIVMVPHFPGAMENAGMITADSKSLVRAGELDARKERDLATLFAHEMAHQWFGDLVTMRWWDDIWLNESFASYLETAIPAASHPDWKLPEEFLADRSFAMSADLQVNARTIRQPIETRDDILNAFDTITYTKGEAILRMFAAALGPDVFQRGVRKYIAAHRYGSATTRDFVDALSAAAGRDLAPDFASFLDQTGVPLVTAHLSCAKDAAPTLQLSQSRLLPIGSAGQADSSWRIPLCLRVWQSGDAVRSCLALTTKEQTVPLPGACPDRVLVNDGAESWMRVRYEGDLSAKLAESLSSLPIADRFAFVDDAAALFEAGRIPAAEALRHVRIAAADRDLRLQRLALEMVMDLDRADLVSADRQSAYQRWIRDLFGARAHAIGWNPRRGESDDETLLRPLLLGVVADRGNDGALIAEALRLSRKLVADRSAVDVSLRETVLKIAARHGDSRLFDAFLAASRAATDERERMLFRGALFEFRDPELFARALGMLADPKLPALQQLHLWNRSFEAKETRDLAWTWTKTHFETIAKRAPSEEAQALVLVPASFCDEKHRAEFEAFFAPKVSSIPGAPRELRQALEQLDLCIARRSAQGTAVDAFLSQP